MDQMSWQDQLTAAASARSRSVHASAALLQTANSPAAEVCIASKGADAATPAAAVVQRTSAVEVHGVTPVVTGTEHERTRSAMERLAYLF
jgi:hypothetical protein